MIRINESVKMDIKNEACKYYQENAFAYDGIEDYVRTDFSHYPKSDQDEIIKFIKKKLN